MTTLGFSFQLQLSFSCPVQRHAFVLRCLPESSASQQVERADIHVLPRLPLTHSSDAFGLKQTGTIFAPHAGFCVQAEGRVQVAPEAPEPSPPDWQLGPYRCHTPMTVPGEALQALNASLKGDDIPDSVMTLLQDKFVYQPGVTGVSTTAEEAAAAMQGVCQDESHVMLSLLRMHGIPCRYVMGYMLGDGSTHAWVEYARDGRWLGLDPTNRRAVNDEYIRIAFGRDANDCPVNRGIFSGSAWQRSQCSAAVWKE
ncbi:MAG: transglutaminase domain-containing protein [Clostridia bacterium]|nr:transglutaminase domain-containing protein [Clostridia bacterium]